jgi:hypothetical protein
MRPSRIGMAVYGLAGATAAVASLILLAGLLSGDANACGLWRPCAKNAKSLYERRGERRVLPTRPPVQSPRQPYQYRR